MWRSFRKGRVALALVVILAVSFVGAGLLPAPARAATSYPKPLAIETGSALGESFGRSVAIADLNGDGVADLIVGAPFNSVPGKGVVGSAFVYLSGPDGAGGIAPFTKILQLNGSSPYDLFGWSVASIGDVNGDGFQDLAVGAPHAPAVLGGGLQTNVGNVTIYSGAANFNTHSANQTLSGAHAGDQFGYSLGAAGDVNLDGTDDFIVGAPYSNPSGLANAGSAYVFQGVRGAPVSNAPSFTFTGNSAGALMGYSVAGGFNVDKNALLDMIAGAPGQNTTAGVHSGAVYLIRNIGSGNPPVNVVSGHAAGDMFGYSVAGLAGMTGNGFGDVAIGAPFNADNGTNAGEVSVIFGGSRFSPTVDLTLMGQTGEQFGASLAAGDFHEDGLTDLLVGAPASSVNVTSGGRAYAFYGSANPGTAPNLTLVPRASDEAGLFGLSVATGGNFTAGHGFDFAVGAPQATVLGTHLVGDAYVYNGTRVVVPQAPTVSGFVCVPNTKRGATCSGIPGFTVSLQNAALTLTALTPASGAFDFGSVPAGTYFLNTTNGGFVDNSTAVTLHVNTNYVFYFFPETIPLFTGLVTDAVTASFVNGVTVAMYNGTALVNSTVSGPSGLYQMYLPVALVPATGKTTNVTLAAFDAVHYTATTGKVALVRNQTVTQNFVLDRFPSISGTVSDATNGNPIPGATVQVTQGIRVLAIATTDNKGNYVLRATNATVPSNVYLNFTAVGHFRASVTQLVDMNKAYVVSPFLARDLVPPTSSLNPLPRYTATAVFPVSGTDSDSNGNGVAEIQLWYKFGNTGSFTLYAAVTNPGPTFTFSFNSTAVRGDGVYQFYSLATDYAANEQATPSGNMTWTSVDTVPPVSDVNALPAYENQAEFTVTASASDAGGVANVELLYRQGTSGAYTPLATDTSAPYAWTFNTTKLGTGDGLYQFYTIATDNAGLVEAAPSSPDTQTTVDTVPPALTITAPTSGQVLGTGWVNVTWSASDATSGIAEFDLQLDSNPWVHAGTALYYNFTYVPDGAHTVSVNATDHAGNQHVAPVSFTVSTVSPVVAIASPTSGAYVASSSVAVTWSVSSTGAGLASIQMGLDARAPVTLAASATTYTFASVADGTHTVTVKAIGLNGAQGTATVDVTVDVTPPSVSISSPATNTWFATPSVSVSFTGSDATSGLQSLMLSVDGGTAADVTGQTSRTVTGLSDGSHTIALLATDRAGNTATASVTVKVDTTSPSVSISSPAANAWFATPSVALTFSASDASSSIASLGLSLDGGAATDVTGLTGYGLTGLSDGSHTVSLTAADQAGNTATATLTVKIDTIKPSLSITAPSANANLPSGDVTLKWAASDGGSGIAKLEISVDNGAFQTASGTSETLSGLASGNHTVVLRATDVAGNVETASVTFTISPVSTPVSPLVIAGIGIVVVAVVVALVAVLYLRRRKGKGPSEPEPPPDAGT